MRYSDNLNSEIDKLGENESYVSTCDKCYKYRIVDFDADAVSREYCKDYYGEGHGEWLTIFHCLCGEEFALKD